MTDNLTHQYFNQGHNSNKNIYDKEHKTIQSEYKSVNSYTSIGEKGDGNLGLQANNTVNQSNQTLTNTIASKAVSKTSLHKKITELSKEKPHNNLSATTLTNAKRKDESYQMKVDADRN